MTAACPACKSDLTIEILTCEWCKEDFGRVKATGVKPKTCSPEHKKALTMHNQSLRRAATPRPAKRATKKVPLRLVG